jgi:hypothetical protein
MINITFYILYILFHLLIYFQSNQCNCTYNAAITALVKLVKKITHELMNQWRLSVSYSLHYLHLLCFRINFLLLSAHFSRLSPALERSMIAINSTLFPRDRC